MKKTLLFYIFILVNLYSVGQINKHGIPLIKNYSPNDYNASEQNWAVCEDNRGVIYVGNNDDGVLEYDGNSWKKIPIPNNSTVRSLAVSDDGTIYVGAEGEVGYLAPDLQGNMKYNSLANQIDTAFKEVWKVYTHENEVYFCCSPWVFKFKDKKLVNTYEGVKWSFLSFQLDNKIYWGSAAKGIFQLDEDGISLIKGGEFYISMDVFTMLPWSDEEILITTIGFGIYLYNKETGLSRSFNELGPNYRKLYNLLNGSQVYNGIRLQNGNYAVTTLDNGVIIFNPSGEVLYKLDVENGLQDITAINLGESSNGNLWITLNKGLAFVELGSPFTKLGTSYGLEGITLVIKKFKNQIFVGTTSGLYVLKYINDYPVYIKEQSITNQVRSLETFKMPGSKNEKLIVATQNGVFEYIKENKVIKLGDVNYNARILRQSVHNPNILYIGHNGGIAELTYKHGSWIENKEFVDIKNQIVSIEEDGKGNIWLGTGLSGIIKIDSDLKLKNYIGENGLDKIEAIMVYNIREEIIAATKSGIYNYNSEEDLFEKYKGFGETIFKRDHEVKKIFIENENNVWVRSVNPITNKEYIEKLCISQDRLVSIVDIPFKRLYKNSFQSIYFDGKNNTWIATSDALYNYMESMSDDFSKYYNSLIRSISIGIDSVVFGGTYYKDTTSLIVHTDQPDQLKIVAPYKYRTFNFYYSTPYFPNDEIQYSYRLDGYDEDWSHWDSKVEKEYTNLNEGHYTFYVKSKNIYGIESEVSQYEFTLKPPWYRTIFAYFIYVVLAIFVVVVIVKIYTRRLELEKIRLEQIVKERTAEVVKQKEEIEEQRDEIAEKNQSITDSIKYAERIQKAILPSNEYAKEILPEHFILFRPRDIVSGDFYWMTKKDNLIVTIAADCTGHGVPGAFMSMLGVSFLNEIVNRHDITSAGEILTQLRADVKKTLGQEGKEGEAKDGMDIALCIVDLEKMKMQYAGAYNPMYLFRNNEMIEVKADRMPIGIYVKEKESFTNNEIELQKGDVYYIFSDGFQDQFGGEDGMKYKTKNYKKLLLEIHQKPMAEQREILDTTVDEWRGEWEQVDDIIILGVRV